MDMDEILSDFREDQPRRKQDNESAYFISDGRGDLPAGIYYQPPTQHKRGEAVVLPPLWICDAFDVVARSRDADSGNHGLLLVWQDMDKVKHELVVTLDMLTGDGQELRKLLMNGGLRVSTQRAAKEKLLAYLLEAKPNKVARSVFAIGWQPGGVYVLPQQTFGA